MATQADNMVRGCRRCDEFQGSVQKAQLCPVRATQPWEMLHVDFTSIKVDADPKVKDIKTLQVLVVIDHFTRFAQAFVLPDKTAQTIA